MDRLHTLDVFVAVAESGSLAEAGRRLKLSPPAVTRAVAALEDRLGASLFTRTTRSLRLTDAGARFLDSARRILGELDEAERAAASDAAAPAGHLALTAPVTLGRVVVEPVVSAFLRAEPRLSASLVMVDRLVNLMDEGIDVAVRVGDLPDSSLVARRVGDVRRLLVASPAYLAERGAPQSPSELHKYTIIAFTGLMAGREWRYNDAGRAAHVAVSPRLTLNDASAAIAAAARGDGITEALSYMVAREIRAGALAPVLAAFAPPPVPVHLVYPALRLPAPKVRAFLDFAAPRVAGALDAARIDGFTGGKGAA